MDEAHASGVGYAPAAVTGTGYGCMLRDGHEVSPTTYPSTNFGESIGGGFTGLTFSVGECGEGSGAVTVSWSDAAKPVPRVLPFVEADDAAELGSGVLHHVVPGALQGL